VKSINFVVLGDDTIVSQLGKKGTTTDISIYDKKTSDSIYTFTVPLTFPEKIQPLIQAINMSEYAILNITKIDKYLGEQIVALDSLNFKNGFILHSYDIDEEKIKLLIRNTNVANFKFINSYDELKQELSLVEPKKSFNKDEDADSKSDSPESTGFSTVFVLIDHAFDVRGVGTVVLGVIRQGTVRIHDQLKIMPADMDVVVKSIQMHDTPVDESKTPARVGLAIKGTTADMISRGDVLCSAFTDLSDNMIKVASDENILIAKFRRNPYFKGQVSENQNYMLAIGLQIKPAKIKRITNDNHNITIIEIAPEKPVVYIPNQVFLVLKLDSPGMRIVGQGITT
jgi:selenocysteine-specific translation elongation factor